MHEFNKIKVHYAIIVFDCSLPKNKDVKTSR